MITREQCVAIRERLGWRPETLAFRAGVALMTVVDFERGRRSPRMGTLIALCNAFRAAEGDDGGASAALPG